MKDLPWTPYGVDLHLDVLGMLNGKAPKGREDQDIGSTTCTGCCVDSSVGSQGCQCSCTSCCCTEPMYLGCALPPCCTAPAYFGCTYGGSQSTAEYVKGLVLTNNNFTYYTSGYVPVNG